MVLYIRFLFSIQTINVTVEPNFAGYCIWWHHCLKLLRSKSQALDSSVCQDGRNLTGTVQPLVCTTSTMRFWASLSHMINALANVTS